MGFCEDRWDSDGLRLTARAPSGPLGTSEVKGENKSESRGDVGRGTLRLEV